MFKSKLNLQNNATCVGYIKSVPYIRNVQTEFRIFFMRRKYSFFIGIGHTPVY